MKKIALAIALGIVLTSPINSYATDNNAEYWYPTYYSEQKQERKELYDSNFKYCPELVDLFSEYVSYIGFKKGKITDVWLEKSTETYSQYSYQYINNDSGILSSYVSDKPYFTVEELYAASELSENDVKISTIEEEILDRYIESGMYHIDHTGKYVMKTTFQFNSDNHSKNISDLMKVKQKIEDEFALYLWNVTINDGGSESRSINWSDMYTCDEYGIETHISEIFTEKQINNLNEELKKKNYNVAFDPETYKMIYDISLKEEEKLELAINLYKDYGLYAQLNYSVYGNPETDLREQTYSYPIGTIISDVKGDINGDGYAWKEDLRYYNDWILATYPLEAVYARFGNPQNGDINEDGIVDEFDVVELRKKFR